VTLWWPYSVTGGSRTCPAASRNTWPGRDSAATARSGFSYPAEAPKEAAQLRTARKELARLERQLERLSGREAQLQQQIIQQAADPAAFRELDGELRVVLAAKNELETRWLEVADAAG
jgi:ATP-binding cassette subfamily F protein uup